MHNITIVRNDTLDLGIARYFRETFNLFVTLRECGKSSGSFYLLESVVFLGFNPSRVNYNRGRREEINDRVHSFDPFFLSN